MTISKELEGKCFIDRIADNSVTSVFLERLSICAGLILNSVLLYLLLISYQAFKLESAAHFGRLFNKLWCGTICMFVVVS